ncbi:MAG: RDD family protein [Bacilli bacterium]|nr:RDD family protein [Bacilli bacterium]
MKPLSYKRIVAYFIDILIITVLSTLLTYFLPENKEYESSATEYLDLLNQYTNKEIEQEDFTTQSADAVYSMNRNSVTVTVVTTVLTISYFVVYAYFMEGQTLGKKLMKIKIVSNDKHKLTMNNYLIRGLLINSILMNILGIIFILGLNKTTYIKVNDITTYLFGFIYVITFGMVLFRDDKRGLHDFLAGTKVIAITDKKEVVEEEKEEVKEKDDKLKDAEIIGEKKLKM